MQDVREAVFIASCSMLVRTIGGVVIFAKLDGVLYSADHLAVTIVSYIAILASLFVAMVGGFITDGVLVGAFVVAPILRRIHKPRTLKSLGRKQCQEEILRLGAIGKELRKSIKYRFDRAGFFLGCLAYLQGSVLVGTTVAMCCVAVQLHLIIQRMKIAQ